MCVVIFISSYTTSCFKQTQLDQYIEEYNEFKEDVDNTQKYADSLLLIVNQNQQKIEQLEDSILIQRSNLDESNERLQQSETARIEAESHVTDSIIQITPREVVVYVNTLEIENLDLKNSLSSSQILITSLTEQNFLLTTSLETQTSRADSLYSILNNIPDAPSNPNKIFFGLIPKPTRTQSFILGVGTGIGITVVGLQKLNVF
jgi:chromosome segregation ATPase